jgi:hypothetical protein
MIKNEWIESIAIVLLSANAEEPNAANSPSYITQINAARRPLFVIGLREQSVARPNERENPLSAQRRQTERERMARADAPMPRVLLVAVLTGKVSCMHGVLGIEFSLSSRGRMTLGVGEIFWFISHTLPQYHAL